MSAVLFKQLVARSLDHLREQPTHVMFAGYLHLQQRSCQLGRRENLQPDFRRFFNKFLRVEDHPIGTPYIKPFNDQKPSIKNLWLNENVAGSYAPSSVRPGQPFSKVVDISSAHGYSLRERHPKLAFEHLLHETKISAAHLAAFLYRDYGFFGNPPTLELLIRVFAFEFGYSDVPDGELNEAFYLLYHYDFGEIGSDCFREIETPIDNESHLEDRSSPSRTSGKVRDLSVDDLLNVQDEPVEYGPPIQELKVKGLLSFGDEAVFRFGNLNILVGPNGSGKSNLIDCLRVFQYAPLDIQSVFSVGGLEAWLYNGLDKQTGSGLLELTTMVSEPRKSIRHQLRLGPAINSRAQLEELVNNDVENSEDAPYFVGSYRSQAILSVAGPNNRRRERALKPNEYNPFRSILSQIRDVTQYPEITRLSILYANIKIYSEWTFGRNSKLREAATTGRSDSQLSEDMHDLPVALNALEQTPVHETILKLLPELKETYRDYVTRVLFGRIGLELVEAPFKTPVPAIRLSDGTLRFLALAVILLQPNPSPIICIEEPELGMHPDMIRMVARMMIDASTKTQLIISTHSEYLLTALQDDFDVLFAFNSGPSGSMTKQFSQNDYKAWRKEHNLGELWTSGELGGNRW